jgi:hypothetical protein
MVGGQSDRLVRTKVGESLGVHTLDGRYQPARSLSEVLTEIFQFGGALPLAQGVRNSLRDTVAALPKSGP